MGWGGSKGEERNVPQLDINSLIALILLLDILKVKVERLGLSHFARCGEFLREGEEFVRG